MKPINSNEFEMEAKRSLDKSTYDYIASGACDEYTLNLKNPLILNAQKKIRPDWLLCQ